MSYKNAFNINKTNTKKNFLKKNLSLLPLIILVLLFIVTQIFFIIDKYTLPLWDESVYIGMGKYIYSGGYSGLWENIRPIGLPLITGIGWLSGYTLLFSKAIAIIFSSLLIILTYMVCFEITKDNRISLLSAIIISINPLFFYNSSGIMTEIPSTVFALLAIYFFIKQQINKNQQNNNQQINKNQQNNKYLFLSGIFAGISVLFKFPQGIIIIALLTVLSLYGYGGYGRREQYRQNNYKQTNVKNKDGFEIRDKTKYKSEKRLTHNIKSKIKINTKIKDVLILSAGFAGILILFIIFNTLMYYNYASNDYTNNNYIKIIIESGLKPFILGSMHQNNIFQSVIDQTVWSHIRNILYYIIVMAKYNILLLLWIPAMLILKDKSNENKYAVLKTASLLMLLYLTVITTKQERYFLMTLPIVSIMAASMIFAVYDSKNILSKVLTASFAGIIVFIIMTSINADKEFYDHAYTGKPNIVNYYEYIEKNNIKGPILVTDPVFAVYTDERLIPFYNTVQNNYSNTDLIYINSWEKEYDINAVAYSDYAFPCTNNECYEFRNKMLKDLDNNYIKVYESNHNEYKRYIFIKENKQ